jgi:hypothetical protein
MREFGDLTSSINVYDLYRRCLNPGPPLLGDPIGLVEINGEVKQYRRHYTQADYTPWLFKENLMGKLETNPLGPCTFGIPMLEWANSKEVRAALHIPHDIQAWEMCSRNVGYDMNKNASQWIYNLIKGKYRILFYSGDTDGAVPTHGTQMWLDNIGWKLVEKRRPYFVNDQVAGYIEERDGLTFGTVHGCGHMAPQWKRAEAYHLVFNWLKNTTI